MANSTDQLSPVSEPVERSQGAVSAAILGEMGEAEPTGSVTNPGGLILLVGLTVLLFRWGGVNALLFVFGLVVMIFLHELGHFVTARKTGMKATRFFVGMGPTIISRTWGETEYGIKAIPAGAFVAISGMHNLDPVAPEDESRAYKNASYPRRMLVITAGSMMHFMQAILIFIFMFSVIGLPDPEGPWTISALSKLDDGSNAPALIAGLELGDKIVSIDGQEVVQFDDLRDHVLPLPGQEVTLGIERDGQVFEAVTVLATVPHEDGPDTGFLGVGPSYTTKERFGPIVGLQFFQQAVSDTFSGMARIFSPSGFQNLGSLLFQGSEDVALDSAEVEGRPVSLIGIVRIAGGDQTDWLSRLFFLASINVFIGIFNLMPVLPLDGGHAAVATYERLRSRKGRAHHVDFAKLLPITYVVVGVLGFLFFSTVWLDIARPIS